MEIMEVMDIKTWLNYYHKIITDFGFSKEDDVKASYVLNNLLNELKNINSIDTPNNNNNNNEDGNKNNKNNIPHNYNPVITIEDLKKLAEIKELNEAIVFGAGPSLEQHIKDLKKDNKIKEFPDKSDYLVISADGATTALLNENIVPDIIVTDLDGKIEDIIKSNEFGSFLVIHSHGDNINTLKKYVPILKNILGTCQSLPHDLIYNFGGFSDGDRAVFLASTLGVKKVILAGMDFGNFVTSYSRPDNKNKIEEADDIKKKKLKYAEELINWIISNTNIEIINLKDY